MLYRTLKRMIQRGQIEGMEAKLDVFYAAGKLSAAEYAELTAMLRPEPGETPEDNRAGDESAVGEGVNENE